MPQAREECLVRRDHLYRRSGGASARVEVVKHPPKLRGEWQPRGDLDDLSTVWFE
jgi:hypothetical protein